MMSDLFPSWLWAKAAYRDDTVGERDLLTILQGEDLLCRVQPHHPALQVALTEGLLQGNGCPRNPG